MLSCCGLSALGAYSRYTWGCAPGCYVTAPSPTNEGSYLSITIQHNKERLSLAHITAIAGLGQYS